MLFFIKTYRIMDLLEEAKLRYPKGSKIIGIKTEDIKQNVNCGKEITLEGTFYFEKKTEHSYRYSDAIYASPNVYVYSQETWAEVIEYKIPDKWCVKVNSSYEDYFELHNWRKDRWKNSGYIDSDKVWMPTKRDSYTEIRIEDFIKYIYKEEEKKEQSFPEYYECIKKLDSFTIGKIYKIKNKNALEAPWNFIDDKGKENGNSGRNHKYFIPSTYEEYCKQEDIKIAPKEEESLIGRYAKIISKGNDNEGKYYLITSKNHATRLFDNVENCYFSNNRNWEIMPKDFKYTGQDNFPKYVKCVNSWHKDWTTGKIYKTEEKQEDFPNKLNVKCDKGEVVLVHSWNAPSTFIIATEQEYLSQQTTTKTIPEYWAIKYTNSNFETLEKWRLSQIDVDKSYEARVGYYLVSKHIDNSYLMFCSSLEFNSKYQEITFEDFKKYFSIEETKKEKDMEDLTGRWIKCIDETHWSYGNARPKIGEYLQIDTGRKSGIMISVFNKKGNSEYFSTERIFSKKEFELMSEGFSPSAKKECSKKYMPKYVEWIDNLGSHKCGRMCGDQFLKKGKIFDTSDDNILPENCETSWKRLWQYYYYNFTESTKKEHDAQNNIITVKVSDTSTTGFKGANPWLMDEVGQYGSGYYTTSLWLNTPGQRKTSWGYAVDVYEKKDKSIKQIELPKPKKRLIF